LYRIKKLKSRHGPTIDCGATLIILIIRRRRRRNKPLELGKIYFVNIQVSVYTVCALVIKTWRRCKTWKLRHEFNKSKKVKVKVKLSP
jgi:hypothetical protein